MRVVESIVVEASADEVWAVISNLDTHTSWRPAVAEFRQVSDGPLGVGTRIREVLEWRGREIVIDDVVTAFEPPRRLAVHGEWPAASFDVEFRLEAVDAGTEVTMDWPPAPEVVPAEGGLAVHGAGDAQGDARGARAVEGARRALSARDT